MCLSLTAITWGADGDTGAHVKLEAEIQSGTFDPERVFIPRLSPTS